ncbi:MAG TPA: hypothetical protein VGF49_24170 [Candidatus Solibacter sp.]
MPEQIETPQPPQTQQVGMSETAICGLSYLTFIPAIIFLATAPYNQNPKVRFHCWQSIFLAIGWVCVAVVATVLAAIPILGILIDMVVWLGFIALWLIVMINAFMGKTIKLPIISAFAEKQAGTTV